EMRWLWTSRHQTRDSAVAARRAVNTNRRAGIKPIERRPITSRRLRPPTRANHVRNQRISSPSDPQRERLDWRFGPTLLAADVHVQRQPTARHSATDPWGDPEGKYAVSVTWNKHLTCSLHDVRPIAPRGVFERRYAVAHVSSQLW